jgi:hypothetical protein
VEAETVLYIDHLAECRANRILAGEAPYRGAHGVTLVEQSDQTPAANESGSARHQNCFWAFHLFFLQLRSAAAMCHARLIAAAAEQGRRVWR